jgi:hypothetical protein
MEIPRTRDVIIFTKDLSIPVMLDDTIVRAGWVGGQGVTWTPSPDDNFLATFSDGTFGGFLLWGSDESSDQFSAYTKNQPTYQFGVVGVGSWCISTIAYEKYTLESRMAGPLVLNTYIVGHRLHFSNRGLFTPQDEFTISGDPRAPNIFFVGSIIQAPGPSNNNYLTAQTTI